jgi:hypothetical protein
VRVQNLRFHADTLYMARVFPSYRPRMTAARRCSVHGCLLALALALIGCRSTQTAPSGGPDRVWGVPEGWGRLTAAPVNLDELDFIVPLGWLNPPGHTFPTDHIYFSFKDRTLRHDIYAPADGYIRWVYHTALTSQGVDGSDYKIEIQHTTTFCSYLDHIHFLDPAIAEALGPERTGSLDVHIPVRAGQRLGTTAGGNGGIVSIDLGVMNPAVTQGFVVPAHYNYATLHADSPLRYYDEPLRSTLYSKVRCDGVDKDGRICLDVDGTLAGNWFSEGAGLNDWSRELAFAVDPLHPALRRIVTGGELGVIAMTATRPTAPDPATVTPHSGRVAYPLLGFDPNLGGGTCYVPIEGFLLVQMLTGRRIRVELRWASLDSLSDFGPSARIYTR